MSPSKSTVRTTRAKNKDTHPGSVDAKRKRATKEEKEAAAEALRAAKKKNELTQHKKLTKIAQAADKIVLDTQIQEALEPRIRPQCSSERTYTRAEMLAELEAEAKANEGLDLGVRPDRPLKRAYAIADLLAEPQVVDTQTRDTSESHVSSKRHSKQARRTPDIPRESDIENQQDGSTTESDEESALYAPTGSESEPFDPTSESDNTIGNQPTKPLAKKKKAGKKASVLSEIQKQRRRLDPILEAAESEVEVEEQGEGLSMTPANKKPRRIPVKAG